MCQWDPYTYICYFLLQKGLTTPGIILGTVMKSYKTLVLSVTLNRTRIAHFLHLKGRLTDFVFHR